MDDWIRDLAYSKRIQQFSVISPATLVDLDNPTDKKKELVKWWGTDPVHLLPAGYSKMAEKLTTRIEKEWDQDEQEKKNLAKPGQTCPLYNHWPFGQAQRRHKTQRHVGKKTLWSARSR